MQHHSSTAHLLVVDDDEVDRELILRSFQKAKIANPVVTAVDGAEALEILQGAPGRPKLPRPYIVILDWRMPRMNGHEFLDRVRADSELRDSVIFVLTTSSAEADIAAAYNHSVSGYIVKERAGQDFMKLIDLLNAYWRVVELPVSHPAA